MTLKIVFMGSPAFAVPTLQALAESPHTVKAVYTQPPRPAGRGQKLTPTAVHSVAESYGIPVQHPTSLKPADVQDALRAVGADVAVVVAYGLLLPKAVLEMFPHGCINVHPSRLPRWRGAAPIHRTVLAGDKETSICIMQMDEGLDTGDVLMQEDFRLPNKVTTGQLHDLLAAQAGRLVLRTLKQIEAGTLTRTPQVAEGVTYANKIRKEEATIDWSQSAEAIERQVRGLNPYPVAVTMMGDVPLKIWKAEMVEQTTTAAPGTVLDDALTIACGNGTCLRVTDAQRPGAKPMSTQELLRGMQIPAGTKLG